MGSATTAAVLDLQFVGSSSGLTDAVLASQRALAAIEKSSARTSSILGRAFKSWVVPIAGAILSAIAAKKALEAFSQSGTPAAVSLNIATLKMRRSLWFLSQAVGELIAPIAQRTAEIITKLAEKLEPLIRRLTGAMPSIVAFMRQLGANFVAAFRPLLPTVFGFIDRILDAWRNMDWGHVFDSIRQTWNKAWDAILQFSAPILVRLASLIETAIEVIGQGISILLQQISKQLGDNFRASVAAGFKGIAQVVLTSILVAISAVELAIRNLPLMFDAIKESWKVASQFVLDTIKNLASDMGKIFQAAFKSIAINLGAAIASGILNGFDAGMTKLPKGMGTLIATTNPTLAKWISDARSGWKAMSGIHSTFQMPSDLSGLPDLKPFSPDVADRLHKVFGPGIAALVADAFAKAKGLIDRLSANLPGINFPQGARPRVADGNVGALLFGTAAAFAKEVNTNNPLVAIGQQQLAQQKQINAGIGGLANKTTDIALFNLA